VFTADGEGDVGDLFAVRVSGGAVYPVTYTRLHETGPALSPSGIMLAYLRGGGVGDTGDDRVVVMNLLNGAERILYHATPGQEPLAVAWHPGEPVLYISTTGGILQAAAPPATSPVRQAQDQAVADSALSILLGSPPFASVTFCSTGVSLCVRSNTGDAQPLGENVDEAMRWGGDSLAYFSNGSLHIRPLGSGRSRRLRWSDAPPNPRKATVSLVTGDD